MSHSRRVFLGASAMFAAVSAFGAGQNFPPASPDIADPDGLDPTPKFKPNPRAILKDNQKEIKKDIKQLTEAVADLQKALDESDIKEVLSLDVVHKTDEIEKLAKQIGTLVRG